MSDENINDVDLMARKGHIRHTRQARMQRDYDEAVHGPKRSMNTALIASFILIVLVLGIASISFWSQIFQSVGLTVGAH